MENSATKLKRHSFIQEDISNLVSERPELKKVKEIIGFNLLEKPYKQLLIPCDRRADLKDEKQIKVQNKYLSVVSSFKLFQVYVEFKSRHPETDDNMLIRFLIARE